MQDAKVLIVRGCKMWHCPNCDQKLAEIVGSRVVIRVKERIISVSIAAEPDQVCWRCGTTSILSREKAA